MKMYLCTLHNAMQETTMLCMAGTASVNIKVLKLM